MKHTHIVRTAAVMLLVAVMVSCGGLKDMAKRIGEVSFTVKPNPLEMQAGKVALNISAQFPAKYFDAKSVVEVTPVLVYGDKTKELRPITLQGEKVQNNFTKITQAGGSVTYTETFAYEPEMKVMQVKLKIRGWEDGKEASAMELPYDKVIAVGTIVTSELLQQGLKEDVLEGTNDQFKGTAFAKVQLPDKTIIPYSATVRYEMQRAELSKKESKNAQVAALVASVDKAKAEKLTYVGTEIASYASPDGPVSLNESLVGKRGATAEGFIGKQLKKSKIEGSVKKETTPAEDWEGFRAELQKSNIQDKEIILRVLTMHQDPAVREAEIRNIAEAYDDLKVKILPLLRRSEIKINFESPQRSGQEILKMAQATPAKLTEVELLHGATLPSDLTQRKAIYQNFVATYPNDWRGPNNLGVVLMGLGDVAGAKAQFEKANSLSNANGIVRNNLGVVAAAEGNYEKAAEYFKNATVSDPAVQKVVDYNLGSIASIKGSYDEGNSKLSGTNTINEAITKLVKGDNQGARSAINASKAETGLKYYVKAIVEARDKNKAEVISNLQKAFAKDASLKTRAASDMEFYELMNDADFKAIL